jgi:flagellin
MAFSINTNNSSMAALESLRMTAADLAKTEKQVATGLAVGSAADNPAIYAIAQQMNGNISGLAAVSSSLSFGAQVVSTAASASSNIIATLQTLQNTVTAAGQTGIDTKTMETQVANSLNQINTYARNSTFNGSNLLTTSADAGASVTNGTLSVVDGLQGTTLNVGNQAVAANGLSVNSLSDALGLTSGMAGKETVLANGSAVAGTSVVQNILTSGASGVNIAVNSALTTASFANNKNVVLTNGDGSTTTFSFDAAGTAPTAANSATNKTVVVTVNTAAESSNQMIGDLVNSMNSNGYNAVVQSDGSVNVTGQGLTGSSSTTASIGLTSAQATADNTANAAANPPVTTTYAAGSGTTLAAGTAVVTTLQSAINKMTSIASTLGNTTTQITGMQTFTSTPGLFNALVPPL